ncbi:MAG: transglutaminase-like domain-containing protein [Bacillota bacterium]|jgi:transglutaminase-like putative cysteine protease
MKRLKIKIGSLLLLLLLAAPVAGGSAFSLRHRRVYEVCQQIRLTKSGGPVLNLRVEAPVFLQDSLPPYQRLLAVSTNMPSLQMVASGTEPVAVYRLSKWRKPRQILLEFNYTFESYAIEYRLPKYAGTNRVEPRYLAPEPEIESAATEITKLAAVLSAKEPYPIDKAVKLFDYVNANIRYQRNAASQHSALRTLQRRSGNCEDFSLLYIALCRAAGLPARFVNGFRFEPAELKKGVNDLSGLGHAWVEINLSGIGWVPVEPTYTYTVNGVKRVNYDFFGKLRADDRHLLFNYSRNGSISCNWSHNRRVRPRVKLDTRLTIRQIR